MRGGATKATAHLRVRLASDNPAAFVEVQLSTHGREGDSSGKQRLDSIFWHATGGDLVHVIRLRQLSMVRASPFQCGHYARRKPGWVSRSCCNRFACSLWGNSIMVRWLTTPVFFCTESRVSTFELGSFGSDYVVLNLFGASGERKLY